MRNAAAACLALIPLAANAGSQAAPAMDVAPTAAVAPAPAPAASASGFGFTLRGGVQSAPGYFGSNGHEIGPDLGFSFRYLRFGSLSLGNSDLNASPDGLSFGGSLRYIGPRKAADYPELAGLTDIDPALELGGNVIWRQRNYALFAAVRGGIGGHDGVVADLGADLIAHPSDRLTLRAGPRALYGGDRYTATYFGVTAAEAAPVSAFAAYTPAGGLVSIGLELGLTYQLDGRWGIDGAIRYDRLTGDAALSPIVQTKDQLSVRLGLTRRFDWRF